MISTIGTRPSFAAPAPAPRPPAAPAQPQDAVTISNSEPQVSGLGKVVFKTGEALAKIGLFGGLAIGGALGLGAALALGGTGLGLPLLGAALLGFEGADAQAAHQALKQGVQSPAFQERAQKNRSLTSLTAGSHIVTLAASSAAFGAGLGLVGGVPGLLVGVAGSLVLAGAVMHAAGKAEKAVLAAS